MIGRAIRRLRRMTAIVSLSAEVEALRAALSEAGAGADAGGGTGIDTGIGVPPAVAPFVTWVPTGALLLPGARPRRPRAPDGRAVRPERAPAGVDLRTDEQVALFALVAPLAADACTTPPLSRVSRGRQRLLERPLARGLLRPRARRRLVHRFHPRAEGRHRRPIPLHAFLYTRVLPALAAGVHVHDVVWPFEHLPHWIREGGAWNEAYLLHALLLVSRDFEIVLWNHYLATHHQSRCVGEHAPVGAGEPSAAGKQRVQSARSAPVQ